MRGDGTSVAGIVDAGRDHRSRLQLRNVAPRINSPLARNHETSRTRVLFFGSRVQRPGRAAGRR